MASSMKKILLLLLVLTSSCGIFTSKSKKDSARPLVIVSAAPYIRIVHQIAKHKVDVQSIIPADVDPHNFEPSPRDMAPLMHAALWVQVGEEFEYLLENRLRETTPDLVILSLPKVTTTLKSNCHKHHHHHDHEICHDVDTHYWLDPLTVIEQAKYITDDLCKILPDDAEYFESRLKILIRKLTLLDNHVKDELKPFHGNAFLTTHKAYGYFCHRYDLVQIGIEAEDGKETRSQDIHQVLQKTRSYKKELIGILLQPQHVNRAAETLGGKLSLPLFMVNPYEENYVATIKKLTNIIVKYGRKAKAK